jgi:hypothetical protein
MQKPLINIYYNRDFYLFNFGNKVITWQLFLLYYVTIPNLKEHIMLLAKTYQRSKDRVVEMITLLRKKHIEVRSTNNGREMKRIASELDKMHLVVKHIDCKLAELDATDSQRSA